MLMLKTLGSLVLGLTTAALGNTQRLSGPSSELVLGDIRIKAHSLVDGETKHQRAMGRIGQLGDSYTRPTDICRSLSEKTTESSSRRPRRRRQNTKDTTGDADSTRAVCQGKNGTTIDCLEEIGCCMLPTGEAACCSAAGVTCDESDCVQTTASIPLPAASSLAIITVTQTITSTVTSFAETRLAIITSTQLLTFINPTQRTATSTVTVTSFVRRAKRTFGSLVEITPVQTRLVLAPTSSPEPRTTPIPSREYMGVRAAVGKRQEATLTSTVVIRTTVFVPGVTTRTLTNIVFSTTLAAPNAATTVFVTTTVFRPLSSSTTTVPEATVPMDQSPIGPTPSSTTGSESATSLTPTDSTETTHPIEPTEPLPTDSPALSSATPSSPAPTTLASFTDVTTTTTITTFPSSETTTTSVMEPTGMETMSLSPTPTAGPNTPLTPQQPTLTPAQIAALVLGIILALLLFIALAFILRRLVIKRRQAQAKIRQHLSPSPPPLMSGGGPSAPAPTVPTGPSSNSSYSGLAGEGEVRIVIRPAPKRRTQSSGIGYGQGMVWPLPPGRLSAQSGEGGGEYSIFVDSPSERGREKEREWSIASERGSLGDDNGQQRGGSMLSGAASSGGFRGDESGNGGSSNDSPESKKSGQSGNGGGRGATLGKKGSFGVGKAW
ncbi:hypothetical protein QC761_403380 [Podospora bellae-mahoneyi]|uniref:Mid2 domain-containing protein n=1 Tax=Podospora bellae-mahoneyi TaxID=2093777 RepID=A0ABR0FK32_9PEZI|nr:hypothetical protein QC761_403380 [Podospora bellae-mahoneyi]